METFLSMIVRDLGLPLRLILGHVFQRGLYCPPLIPARIRRNPVNSRNSIGINFGTVACQIDKTILAECGTEFTFRRNGSGNHTEGTAPE